MSAESGAEYRERCRSSGPTWDEAWPEEAGAFHIEMRSAEPLPELRARAPHNEPVPGDAAVLRTRGHAHPAAPGRPMPRRPRRHAPNVLASPRRDRRPQPPLMQPNRPPALPWTARAFLRAFPKRVFPDDPAAARRVRRAALEALEQETPPDAAGAAIVLYAAAVLAAHRELLTRGLSLAHARDALVEPFRRAAGGPWVRWTTRLLLRLMGPRRFLRAMGGERTHRSYGALFVFAQDEAPGRHRHWVLRCGFHDYLARRGAAFLTPVFCAWDALWADEIHRHGRTLRFHRPQTIADGADRCLFEFRFDPPRARD